MVDYYAELKLDKMLSTDDINRELSKQENLWKRRELNNPEKATKMLALIIEAREVFKSNEARRKYDQTLEPADKKTDRNNKETSDRLQMDKHKSDAINFFNSKQYDLALITINKAMSLMARLNIEDSSILNLAADIYRYNGDNRTALNYINRAIISDSEDPMNYLIKAAVVEDIEQKRNNLKIALDIADKNRFTTIKKEILGVYARSLYFEYPQDKVQAEKYARDAISLGETWGNAQEVINAVEKEKQQRKYEQEELERQARERAEKEKAQKQAEEKRRREQAKKEQQQKATRTRGAIIKVLSLVIPILLFIFCLHGSLGTVKAAEVLCFGGIALVLWIMAWIHFWF